MFAHFFAGCLLTLAGLPTHSAAPIPDVVVPGTRSIRVALLIEAQPLIDHCCVQHVVAKGETLSTIAANHRQRLHNTKVATIDGLSPTSVKYILDLNPGIKPDQLAIGQRIWLPSQRLQTINKEHTFVFIDQRWPLGGLGIPFAPSDKINSPRRGQTALILVPASQLASYTKAAKSRDWKQIEKIKASKGIQVLSIGGSGHSVWSESPVYTCKDTITVERSKKGAFSAKLNSIAYDKAGKVVSPAERRKDHRKNKKGMWFFLLPLSGGGWLLWRMRRQRANQPGSQATLATA
ncbi:MAG: hypothetical protein ACI89X_000633 [Planctomycetota bacterium]|jgi:hypothetical protein